MFTGIVEESGRVVSRHGNRLRIAADVVLQGSEIGASLAVNGCCLTVIGLGTDNGTRWWEADVSDETYSRTNLGELSANDIVNLERPMALGERLGGHIVLGHVDGIGHVISPAPDLVVQLPAELMSLIVEKGSITVDGISLTVFDLTADTFRSAIIPHTQLVTTLSVRQPGDAVNIEMDIVAKHVQQLVAPHLRKRWWKRR